MDKIVVEAVGKEALVAEHPTMPSIHDERQAKRMAIRLSPFRLLGSPLPSDFSLRNGDSSKVPGDIPLPKSIATHLEDMFTDIARGKAVAIIPVPKEITSKRAATILNINHPEMINLLDEGEVPYRRDEGERKILLSELLHYKHREKERKREFINDLTRETQLMGLYEL